MSAIPKPRFELEPLAPVENPQRLVLDNISWDTYATIADSLGEKHIRLTYDRGRLEFMTLSPEHERYKKLFGRLVDVMGEEFDIAIGGFGSMTCKKKSLERALEPDECYYTANLERMRGIRRLLLERDPAPDLVLEIDITRSSIDRMAIYAAMGVPELWRFDGKFLHVYRLRRDKQYEEIDHSPTFPTVAVSELVRFVEDAVETANDTRMVRQFRSWLREQATLARQPRKGKRKK